MDNNTIVVHPEQRNTFPLFSDAKEMGKSAVKNTYGAVSLTVDAAAKIKSDSGATLKVFRFGRYALLGLQQFSKNISIVNLRSQLVVADKVIDCFSLIGDIDYFVNRRFKKEGEPINKLMLIGNIFITAVDLGSVASWLNDLKILDLGRISLAMGKVPVLKIVTTASLGTCLGVGAIIGVGFFTADAVRRAIYAENKEQRTKAMIDIATNTAKIALITFTLSGGTNVPTLVVLGTLSAGLGIAGFLYGQYHKEALEAKPKEILKPEIAG